MEKIKFGEIIVGIKFSLSIADKVKIFEIIDKNANKLYFIISNHKLRVLTNNNERLIVQSDLLRNFLYYSINNKLSKTGLLDKSFLSLKSLLVDFSKIDPDEEVYLNEIKSDYIEINGKKMIVYNNDIIENLETLKIDFVIPKFQIFLLPDKEITHLVLRDAYIPPTHIYVKDNEIKDVNWIIFINDKFYFIKYPFNTGMGVCTNLNRLIKLGIDITPQIWYSEFPNTDIPSISISKIPILLYALKNNKHDLLYILNRSFGKELIELSYKIIVKYNKSNMSQTFEGKNDIKFLNFEVYKYFVDRYGDKIHLEDTIILDEMKLENRDG